MFWTRLVVSLTELVLSVLLAVFVVFWSYESFVRMTADYDAEEELRKSNTAVAILLTSLMVATSLLMQQSVYPVIGTLTVYLTNRSDSGISFWRLLAFSLGHLVLGFLLAAGSVELALRLFERLASGIEEDAEIRRGNVAVAVVMAGVILVTAFYLQGGVSALTKSLIPQPSLGQIGTFR